jgi:hypothetical protein
LAAVEAERVAHEHSDSTVAGRRPGQVGESAVVVFGTEDAVEAVYLPPNDVDGYAQPILQTA